MILIPQCQKLQANVRKRFLACFVGKHFLLSNVKCKQCEYTTKRINWLKKHNACVHLPAPPLSPTIYQYVSTVILRLPVVSQLSVRWGKVRVWTWWPWRGRASPPLSASWSPTTQRSSWISGRSGLRVGKQLTDQ